MWINMCKAVPHTENTQDQQVPSIVHVTPRKNETLAAKEVR
jgi:hypothetical protein